MTYQLTEHVLNTNEHHTSTDINMRALAVLLIPISLAWSQSPANGVWTGTGITLNSNSCPFQCNSGYSSIGTQCVPVTDVTSVTVPMSSTPGPSPAIAQTSVRTSSATTLAPSTQSPSSTATTPPLSTQSPARMTTQPLTTQAQLTSKPANVPPPTTTPKTADMPTPATTLNSVTSSLILVNSTTDTPTLDITLYVAVGVPVFIVATISIASIVYASQAAAVPATVLAKTPKTPTMNIIRQKINIHVSKHKPRNSYPFRHNP